MTRVQFALFCNIAFDGVSGDADGGDEISIRPKTVGAPVVILENGKLFFDFACSVCFDEANHGADGHLWRYGDEEMNVVTVVVRLFEIELRIELGNLDEFPVEVFPEVWGDDGMTVFGRKDEVIVAEIDAMIVSSILLYVCHPFRVYEGRRNGYGNSLHPSGSRHGVFMWE